MTFKDRFIHVAIIATTELLAILLLIYSFDQANAHVPVPGFIRQAINPGGDNARTTPQLRAVSVLPYPNETEISTLPNIEAQFAIPVSNNVKVTTQPQVSYTVSYSEGRTKVTFHLKKPLKTKTTYTIAVAEEANKGAYSWSFTTGTIAVDQKLIPAIDRVKEQIPYSDPNGAFEVYYAAQTDLYFITIHDDERSETDKNAALSWLRSQGITDIQSLQTVFMPSDAF